MKCSGLGRHTLSLYAIRRQERRNLTEQQRGEIRTLKGFHFHGAQQSGSPPRVRTMYVLQKGRER
jgi:hypothetical protein